MKNIVLIGMPGAGKSTIGVLLAKTLGLDFIDTDLIIQKKHKRLLQQLIDSLGPDEFLKIEQDTLCSLNCSDSVIATGGSAVYCDKGMQHLKKNGIFIYLKLKESELLKRIKCIKSRGIVLPYGSSFSDIYIERTPLYEKYADYTVNCHKKSVEDIVHEIVIMLTSTENNKV